MRMYVGGVFAVREMLATVALLASCGRIAAGAPLRATTTSSHEDPVWPSAAAGNVRCVDLVADCGAIGDGITDDTASFALCQQKARAAGGCITVPAGRFACIAVAMNTSHTEWRMSPAATFVPAPGMKRAQSMFILGEMDGAAPSSVTNLTIAAPVGSKFVVDISKPQLVGAFAHACFLRLLPQPCSTTDC